MVDKALLKSNSIFLVLISSHRCLVDILLFYNVNNNCTHCQYIVNGPLNKQQIKCLTQRKILIHEYSLTFKNKFFHSKMCVHASPLVTVIRGKDLGDFIPV